jgi:hypothetical protein
MARAGTLAQNEGDFRETVARLRDGKDLGAGNPTPAFDPKQAQEFREEAAHGRKEESYVQALESAGLKYFTDLQLVQKGMYPTGEGLWRHPNPRYELAFTGSDLLGGFSGPEAFDRWIKAHKKAHDLKAELARRSPAERQEARIVLARG